VIAKTLACIASRPSVAGVPRPIWGINLSVASLADAGIVAFIQQTLAASGVDPSRICFEINEMVASAHLFRVGGLVRELKRLGCNIALDDFGGGVVTFEHFRTLPVDWLKIDGSIISRVPEHAFDTAVVEAIARVCRALDVRIIAEGVETRQTYEVLQYVGVDAMQGFLLHRPEPIENL
jgi:EAL domain-containing protein (putative c-di-GMP-specific phosphodiesterase class I)